MTTATKTVTVIPGDGIGPECVKSAQEIIAASGAAISWDEQIAGASAFRQGIASGVPDATIESVHKTRCVLKGPLETPVGFGEKSANVTLRKLFETYANIRPVRELPGVVTPYSGRGIDLVVIRENVEDLYAGIEHMQTPGVAQCLKLISRKGCEKVVRLAFEFARAEGRKSIACATKSNIMKMTEGLLKRTFEEVAKEYPDIESWHVIIDNCAHQLVKKPEQFDIIVTTNMNGDIISDLTSALVGGLGFAPSANIGNDVAIFEAVHGSAPKYAGKNVINPSAVIGSAIMMLRHLGEYEAAEKVENAMLVTFEEGKHKTGDVVGYGSPEATSTTAFTEAIIANLGKTSSRYRKREHSPIKLPKVSAEPALVFPKTRRVIGADVFVEANQLPSVVGPALEAAVEGSPIKLKMISNRGTQVYPSRGAITDCIDQHRCRFVLRDLSAGNEVTNEIINDLIARVTAKFNWMHIEKLQEFDGAAGYTKAQGED
ncbi:NADP-dependent isocitrate dehydrogenase [Tuwongella immobilis]|uniref:Isocitrate dehydrogenase [NADP] n=1 Tax=Tuwongella immobilis TaxID=692036 RepID=A0A6C2YJX3_9BACT|nr:NADP-dependent isocitrate dehydrogenase [Tuwongella immobilis]VIP01403.1 isocitrate dehydrogenase : Isocitrate/isopropylmalate dehydrogenase OS=Chloracidobacterium thermophilum (strain B) GN=Cabther_A1903 PE=3 SV=1: Iso_dh [Tuwongella immobilis]VTR98302.1 isocitrate dehydrogenase : Isocitrate/isopropylmalate dehydrogenase OS=Chloracidobacterium thermophilum (strain B) GN=Cabther_A1903 PE=3 SV=1: Iso_dh [Tuwongella immobilis]